MKRSPLRRLTPLRSTSTLKRTTPLKAGKQSRGVPKDVYAAVVLRDGGCRAVSLIRSVQCAGRIDPHHIIRRSQGGPDTPENLVCLCRAHHSWVHEHPEQSYALGLLRRSWQS